MTAPARGHTWQAFSRDAGYQLSGPLPIRKTSGVLRHLGVDTCELTTPLTGDAYGRLAPGCGAVVNRDGVQQFSGMVGSSRRIEWDAKNGERTLTVQLLGDDQHLADRLVYPSPLATPSAQSANYWQFTGPASSAMWALIDQQAGPGAQVARRVPTLVMGDDPAIGASRLWAMQWAPVLDTLTSWGVLSGEDLGVRITTTSDGLRADVYAPRDLTAGVRFSAKLSNLTGWAHEQQPPGVTFAIAAGPGNLSARVRRWSQSVNAGDLSWGRRIESYIDQRDETDTTKLQQVAVDAIVEGIGTTALTTTAADTPSQTYGEHWGLGDRVTVHVGLPDGPTLATIVNVVREVLFEVDDKGREKITPAIGTPESRAIHTRKVNDHLKRFDRKVAALERNQ